MNYDKPLLAGLLGALSTLISEIVTQLLVVLGIGKYSIYELDSLLVTLNRSSIFIGFIVNVIAGGTIAVLFYYAIGKLGRDYLVYKGLAVGLLSWGVFELILTATIEGHFFDIRPMADYYTHLVATSVYGILLGLLFDKYLFTASLKD
ncbi:Hypothetical protein LUCI_3805 [Lucifera butyrica]|uniref:Uncharacterized protein n=1 Tax=Lucifera butyrica TaxID=1351585 RepID=A0A498RC85_9FIRM|nr:hypothetical protein [Lucifera butyrica]VBB08527.1 Hypothetical protein LUCI_3805 [Lucifera butyrica]